MKDHDKNKELSYIKYWDKHSFLRMGNVSKVTFRRFLNGLKIHLNLIKNL